MTQIDNLTAHDALAYPNSQLLVRALSAIAGLEVSLAKELEGSRSAIHSASPLDSLTNLNHAIIQDREELDALDLIAPRRRAAEEFHSGLIS